jgi:Nif-specific regulatory protein
MSSFAEMHPRGCLRGPGLPGGCDSDADADSCRVIQDLSLLLEISQTMESSLQVRDLVRPTLRKLAGSIGMTRGAISLLDQETGQPAVEEVVSLSRTESPADYWQDARPLFKQVVTSGQALVVTDISRDEHFRHRTPPGGWGAQGEAPPAFLCVPIKHGDQTIGTLSIERCAAAGSSFAADLRLLTVIARIIAQATHLRHEAESRLTALRRENERLQEQIAHGFKPDNMVGSSNAMRSVYLHIEQVAASDTTVLIRGESGVGKELVARALHEQSPRSGRAFVKFNCAALPESIIESELFGHEKGAFTGAIAMRQGRFETAHRGTIFLDEIGDLSPATQVKFLRVLQEREFERVGSHQPIRCDVRVIAATSRNLEDMLTREQFRSDLYYRLNVFPIYIPPLRERKADLLQLADHFLEKYAKRASRPLKRISTAAIDLLMAYHWPGNVRELENCMERAVLLATGDAVEAQHLPPTLQMAGPQRAQPSGTLESALRGLEHELICAELKRTNGNMAEAARSLGITERIMGLRVKEFRIDPRRFRPLPVRSQGR